MLKHTREFAVRRVVNKKLTMRFTSASCRRLKLSNLTGAAVALPGQDMLEEEVCVDEAFIAAHYTSLASQSRKPACVTLVFVVVAKERVNLPSIEGRPGRTLNIDNIQRHRSMLLIPIERHVRSRDASAGCNLQA